MVIFSIEHKYFWLGFQSNQISNYRIRMSFWCYKLESHAVLKVVQNQGYSKRQNFSPFPLSETCSFFLIWYFMIKKSMLVVGLIKKDSNIIFICSKPNYHFFWLCNTKLEKKECVSNSGKGGKSCRSE